MVSKAFVNVPEAKPKDKITPRAEEGILIDNDRGNGYRIFYPSTEKVSNSQHVDLIEYESLGNTVVSDTLIRTDMQDFEFDEFVPHSFDGTTENILAGTVDGNAPELPAEYENIPLDAARRLKRSNAGELPDRYAFSAICVVTDSTSNADRFGKPTTVEDAVIRPYASYCRKAMDEGISFLRDLNTWTLVALPKDTKCYKTKWIYDFKTDHEGNIERRKARLVEKWFTKRHAVDYHNFFSPVAKHTNFRIFTAFVTIHGWLVTYVDVKNAVLNAKLSEEIYVA